MAYPKMVLNRLLGYTKCHLIAADLDELPALVCMTNGDFRAAAPCKHETGTRAGQLSGISRA